MSVSTGKRKNKADKSSNMISLSTGVSVIASILFSLVLFQRKKKK